MHIQINHYADSGEPEAGIPAIEVWGWSLVKADGTVICRGPTSFSSEKEARSQIAEAKKSMKGASRCKVLSPE
jgi:hypothetical protein